MTIREMTQLDRDEAMRKTTEAFIKPNEREKQERKEEEKKRQQELAEKAREDERRRVELWDALKRIDI